MQVAGFFAALAAVLVSTVTSSLESAAFSESAVQHDAVELPYRPDFFHMVFMLASAYLVGWVPPLSTLQEAHILCMLLMAQLH